MNMNFPIVELLPQIPEWIERVPEIGENIADEIQFGDLHPNLHFLPDWDYLVNKGAVEREADGKDHIYLYQPFCQYLWSLCLYQPLFFDRRINAPLQISLGLRSSSEIVTEEAVRYSENIYFLARRLKDTRPNDNLIRNFPQLNPSECFDDEIGRANAIYCAGIAFISVHEYAHHYLGHTVIQNSYVRSVDDELAADNFALGAISELFDTEFGITYIIGICTVLSALLLSSADSITGNGTHPDMDVRIRNTVRFFDLPEPHYVWGYMALAIKKWLMTFGGLTIQEDMQIMQNGFESYKGMFNTYLDILESTRKRMFPKELPRDWEMIQ